MVDVSRSQLPPLSLLSEPELAFSPEQSGGEMSTPFAGWRTTARSRPRHSASSRPPFVLPQWAQKVRSRLVACSWHR